MIGEIGLVRSLATIGIPIYVGSEIENNPVLHSKYVQRKIMFSSYDSIEFIDQLCNFGKTLDHKPVIFSDDDRAILNISNNRERLAKYYHLLYPNKEMVAKILDKQRFTELSELYQLPSPESYQVSTTSDFEQIVLEVPYPCIIKPTQRHFWWGDEFVEKVGKYQKAFKCSNESDLRDLYQKISEINPSVVIQEYVQGEVKQHVSANLFVDKKGAVKGYYIAQKFRIYPIKAGTGTYVMTVGNNEVVDISKKIIEKLNLRGLVNIQFKQDSRTGQYKLMEIHARNSLWSLLGGKAGANLAELYYNYLVDGQASDKTVVARPGVKYINLSKDVRAFWESRAAGTITFGEWLASFKGDRVFAVLSFVDPAPMLYQWLQIISARLSSLLTSNNPAAKPQTDSQPKSKRYVVR
ncbi:carboxylate--amine ligase [Fodinibius sp. AD559]|uniref:carboxylate--amine ligase n=1 Tax=Fodinibius sp. AD559 TaxID=3424179 RepID=UPI004046EDEE